MALHLEWLTEFCHCVYFLNTPSDVPVVIDTGASISLTPHLTDFTRTLRSANVMELKGLSHTTKVMGCGPISSEVVNYFGTIQSIWTQAYYIPDATICLFSPQLYFQEHQSGSLTCNATQVSLSLAPFL